MEHLWCKDKPRVTLDSQDSQDSPRSGLGGSHHLSPYNILCSSPQGPHPNGFLSRDSQIPKFQQLGLSQLWRRRTFCVDLQSQWGLKQSYSPRWELFNGVSQSTCTHQGRVDSRFLVVGSQIVNLTLGLSFVHNLCCRCPNGSCKPIFDIYTSIDFQWYKERLSVRCFDRCNRTLKFWESRWTPKSPFWEWGSHLLTLPK